MPVEPLTREYLRQVQGRVLATRQGSWDLLLDDEGHPCGFGPFSFVETWRDAELVPAIDFCQHARTDIPQLLGEVARLTQRLALAEARTAAGARDDR
ncbi:hypothetical protein [Streptomyces vilmorinianum]|uniref:hypothetical protein n=1 Tax=Streptomyces vilmorinianum TaxID=3051092 RepID=UPI0010FB19D0|nr:hypothetical protein [Streptomyces vilmorinianum]